jgi:hypothetical protein
VNTKNEGKDLLGNLQAVFVQINLVSAAEHGVPLNISGAAGPPTIK